MRHRLRRGKRRLQCPECGLEAHKVIFLGLPMKICSDKECALLWGVWSWVPLLFPVTSDNGFGGRTFAFLAYECSYPKAFLIWLFNPPDQE